MPSPRPWRTVRFSGFLKDLLPPDMKASFDMTTPQSTRPIDPSFRAYLLGGGIGSMAAAAFMIRDAGVPGAQIHILEALPLLGGSLDGAGDAERGYSLRGGRMLTTDNYECTWDLFKSIPSLEHPGQSVLGETLDFNEKYKAHSQARLVNRQRARAC